MKQSVYLETTIPSYLAARTSSDLFIANRQATTHKFWENERQKYDLSISRYVLDECSQGDPDVAKRRLQLLDGIEILDDIPNVSTLANIYMRLLSIPQKNRIDAFHLAMCCVHEVNILLSWNCTHLGVDSMQIIQKHNDKHGLFTPKMVTPDYLAGKNMEVDFYG